MKITLGIVFTALAAFAIHKFNQPEPIAPSNDWPMYQTVSEPTEPFHLQQTAITCTTLTYGYISETTCR